MICGRGLWEKGHEYPLNDIEGLPLLISAICGSANAVPSDLRGEEARSRSISQVRDRTAFWNGPHNGNLRGNGHGEGR
jgi:hypothetical protein